MSERDSFCAQRWKAPRSDAPRSVPVEHVCERLINHAGLCLCSCGAARSEGPVEYRPTTTTKEQTVYNLRPNVRLDLSAEGYGKPAGLMIESRFIFAVRRWSNEPTEAWPEGRTGITIHWIKEEEGGPKSTSTVVDYSDENDATLRSVGW